MTKERALKNLEDNVSYYHLHSAAAQAMDEQALDDMIEKSVDEAREAGVTEEVLSEVTESLFR